jgi:ABC-type lipoprotein export system ATPase subunit
MDEPTSALDSVTKNIVMDLFFRNKGFTVISTSHDDEWASRCDRIIEI